MPGHCKGKGGAGKAAGAPLLHGDVLVVNSDPLACRPAEAGLLLQSAVLLVVQLLKLSSPSLLSHLKKKKKKHLTCFCIHRGAETLLNEGHK